MTIWLVRHGESALNAAGIRHRREESPLTSLGVKQAAEVRLPCIAPLVLTSPMQRAYGTACIIASAHGFSAPKVVEMLTERDYEQTCAEAARPVARLLAQVDEDAVVITHAGIIKGLLSLDSTPPNGSVLEWKP